MKNGRFWPPYHLSRSVHEGGDNCDARDGAAKTGLLGLRGTRNPFTALPRRFGDVHSGHRRPTALSATDESALR